MRPYTALTIMLLAAPFTQPAAAQTDCEPARCAVQAAINEQCPCEGPQFTNHGRFVSCVARLVNGLAKDGTIPNECKGKVKRCAARSTCGKPGFVTCTRTAYGTCDTATGTCADGASSDGTCAADTDCVAGTRCSTLSSVDRCVAVGGVVGSGTCCATCSTPTP